MPLLARAVNATSGTAIAEHGQCRKQQGKEYPARLIIDPPKEAVDPRDQEGSRSG